MSSILLLAFALAIQVGVTERARVYELGSDSAAPLFTFERTTENENKRTVTDVRFRDSAGEVAASEQVTYVDQAVVRYELFQHQVNEHYRMTVSGEEALFEVEKQGKTTQTRQIWTPDTLTIDQIRPFVEENWERLMQGKELDFRLVALNRARIVKFTLESRGLIQFENRPAVMLRMEAENFFVRLFAPEIELIFTPEGKNLLEVRGPLPLKMRQGDDWVDFDARLVWAGPTNVP